MSSDAMVATDDSPIDGVLRSAPRRVQAVQTKWHPSIFHVCCASYCFIKGVQALCFSSMLRFTLVRLSLSDELSHARSTAAYFGFLKVSHMFITGTFIQSLLFPKRIAAVIAFSCGMFSLFLLILSSNINARLNSPGQYYPVFTFSAIAIVTCLSVSLHCIDACCDCLLQERKAQAQITRKITSVAGSCMSVALLILPADFFLVPVLAFACCTIFLGVAVSLCWWFLRENAEVTFREMKKKSNASFLTCSHICVVVFAAVIGDSADQILDAITNVEIDALVSGGKVKAAVAKEVVSILASSSSACLYLRYNVFGSASSFHRSSLKICLICENIGVLLVTSITLSEKVVGSVFGSSRAQVEADWLVAVSVRSVPGQSISMLISPAFWMSTSELLNGFVGNLIKLSLDMANISNNYIYIIVDLLFFLCCAIWLQAFMIRVILSKKLD